MNVTEQGIAHVQRQWHEAPVAKVIPFPTKAERLQRQAKPRVRAPRPSGGGEAA